MPVVLYRVEVRGNGGVEVEKCSPGQENGEDMRDPGLWRRGETENEEVQQGHRPFTSGCGGAGKSETDNLEEIEECVFRPVRQTPEP